MKKKLRRIKKIMAKTGLSRSSIYRMMKEEGGTFPRPVKIGAKAVAWRSKEIDAWIKSRPKSSTTPPK